MQPLCHVPVPSLLQHQHPDALAIAREKRETKRVTWDSGIRCTRSAAAEGFPGKIVTWMTPLITYPDPIFGPHYKPETLALSPLETHNQWYIPTEMEIKRSTLHPYNFWYKHEIPRQTFDTRRFDIDMEKQLYLKPDTFEVIEIFPYRYRTSSDHYILFWLDQYDIAHGEAIVYYPGRHQIKYQYMMQDNIFQGEFTSYYPNGNKSIICTYYKGVLHGKLYWYDAAGTLVNQEEYHMGNPCGEWRVWSNEKKMYETVNHHRSDISVNITI